VPAVEDEVLGYRAGGEGAGQRSGTSGEPPPRIDPRTSETTPAWQLRRDADHLDTSFCVGIALRP
jgi:hypothetical protein